MNEKSKYYSAMKRDKELMHVKTQTNLKNTMLRESSQIKGPHIGVPVVAQWLTNLTKNREVSGLIPGLGQWLRIRRCRELQCRSQMRLGSHVAVAVVQAGGYSSDQTPGNLHVPRERPQEWQKDKERKKKKYPFLVCNCGHFLECVFLCCSWVTSSSQ